MESRLIIIGEEAIEGHALTDMYENSEISIRNKMKKWIANCIFKTDLTSECRTIRRRRDRFGQNLQEKKTPTKQETCEHAK